MVDESNIEMNAAEPTDDAAKPEVDVIYSCLRCNTKVSSSELDRLPEINVFVDLGYSQR